MPDPSAHATVSAMSSALTICTLLSGEMSGVRHGKEPFEVRADVVVGADGRYSTVAKLGGFAPEYEHHDFDVIWFTIEQPSGWSSTFYVSLGENVRGLMLPKYPHHIQAGLAQCLRHHRAGNSGADDCHIAANVTVKARGRNMRRTFVQPERLMRAELSVPGDHSNHETE